MPEKPSNSMLFQPASWGCQLQSMPSSSIASCAADRDTVPVAAIGQMKRPFSRRLANKHRPWGYIRCDRAALLRDRRNYYLIWTATSPKPRPSPPRRTRHSTPSCKVAWFCYAPLADFYFGVDSPIKLTVRRMGRSN
jgi:hypothetical protein